MRNRFQHVLSVAQQLRDERDGILMDQEKERKEELQRIDNEGRSVKYRLEKPAPRIMLNWPLWLPFVMEQAEKGYAYFEIAAEISNRVGHQVSGQSLSDALDRYGLKEQFENLKKESPRAKIEWKKHEKFVVNCLDNGNSHDLIVRKLSARLGREVTRKSLEKAIANHCLRAKANKIQERNQLKKEENQNVSK